MAVGRRTEIGRAGRAQRSSAIVDLVETAMSDMSKAMVHAAASEFRKKRRDQPLPPGDFGRIADTIGSPECDGTGNCPQTFRKTEKDSLTDVTRDWNLQAILLFARILPGK